MEKRRIFLAIDIPDKLKNIAESCIHPFYKEKFVRIPEKEGWHITVVFCGYLDETEIKALEVITARAVSQTKVFSLSPEKVLFVPEKRPRMVWLRFRSSSGFEKLKMRIEDEIVKKQTEGLFGDFKRETRTIVPHLTLARFEEIYFSRFKKLLPEVDLKNETETFLAKSVQIMESHLSPQGVGYEILKKFNLESVK